MREAVKHLVRGLGDIIEYESPIYDFGSYQESGQEGEADIRPLFQGKEYVGVDIRSGPGVDVVDDLHGLEHVGVESVGVALCLDTIEHVEYPRKAVDSIYASLVNGGVAIFTSHMNFYIHNAPIDYWRFTPQGFASLLKPFSRIMVEWAGDPWFPHTVIGIGWKNSQLSDDVYNRIIQWVADEWRPQSYDWVR